MSKAAGQGRARVPGLVTCVIVLGLAFEARAQSAAGPAPSTPDLQIYGFAQADTGFDFMQNDPDWFDVNRPSKLPSAADEFGRDGRTFLGVRQSRFGVKASAPTSAGPLQAVFEFDMFGVGVDAGQTTIRLRLAYGTIGHFGAGQLPSPFMDPDVFPNTLDYWGPNGMPFFRNVLVFWQPVQGRTRLTLAAERPGASADGGRYADRVALQNVQLRFPAPDLSAACRVGRSWGYIRGAAIVRFIRFDDLLQDSVDLNGGTTGWGMNVSSNVKPDARDVLRLQVVYGRGVENYLNDAPVDVAAEVRPDSARPLRGRPLPLLGITAFLDHTWNPRWSSTVGYSRLDVDNSNGQTADAFRQGQYALANLVNKPVPDVMIGAELQWARRGNFADGFHVNDIRVQVSCRFSFSQHIVGAR
jgi:hypothetical protein